MPIPFIPEFTPWTANRMVDEDGTRYHLVVNAHGCSLARLQHCAEDPQHAALFAAAPDLLLALQGAFDLMSAMRAVASDRIDISKDPRWLNVRAAISRATTV